MSHSHGYLKRIHSRPQNTSCPFSIFSLFEVIDHLIILIRKFRWKFYFLQQWNPVYASLFLLRRSDPSWVLCFWYSAHSGCLSLRKISKIFALKSLRSRTLTFFGVKNSISALHHPQIIKFLRQNRVWHATDIATTCRR